MLIFIFYFKSCTICLVIIFFLFCKIVICALFFYVSKCQHWLSMSNSTKTRQTEISVQMIKHCFKSIKYKLYLSFVRESKYNISQLLCHLISNKAMQLCKKRDFRFRTFDYTDYNQLFVNVNFGGWRGEPWRA